MGTPTSVRSLHGSRARGTISRVTELLGLPASADRGLRSHGRRCRTGRADGSARRRGDAEPGHVAPCCSRAHAGRVLAGAGSRGGVGAGRAVPAVRSAGARYAPALSPTVDSDGVAAASLGAFLFPLSVLPLWRPSSQRAWAAARLDDLASALGRLHRSVFLCAVARAAQSRLTSPHCSDSSAEARAGRWAVAGGCLACFLLPMDWGTSMQARAALRHAHSLPHLHAPCWRLRSHCAPRRRSSLFLAWPGLGRAALPRTC
jgi:hypothetical protein